MKERTLIFLCIFMLGVILPAWLYTMYHIHPEYGFFITDDLVRRAFGG